MPCGGGGTHRSWPGGQGGKPRALVAGEGGGSKGFGAGAVGGGEGLDGSSKKGPNTREEAPLGLGGGPRASVPGGYRGTGPRDGANFATCVVFLTFLTQKKNDFFEGYPVEWGGVQGLGRGGPGAVVPGG